MMVFGIISVTSFGILYIAIVYQSELKTKKVKLFNLFHKIYFLFFLIIN